MNNKLRTKNGFSLTEVLFAVGILAVGMVFIAGVFPVAIRFVTIAAERSIAAVVADEAFAKIKLYSVNPAKLTAGQLTPAPIFFADPNIALNEFFYPSTAIVSDSDKQYCWTALCGPAGLLNVQVTVFVCRRNTAVSLSPVIPVWVTVAALPAGRADELQISNLLQAPLINDGSTIVDNGTGQIYRVLERDADNPSTPAVREDQIIRLDRNWLGVPPVAVWVVPPPVGGGRYPCVAVYQKVIRF